VSRSILDSVAENLSPIERAHALQVEAARVGFDWPDVTAMIEKIREETRELSSACARGDRASVEEEIGDLLLVLVNVARSQEIEAASCLAAACRKFERRFRAMEARLAASGRRLEEETLETMDALWRETKADEGEKKPS
jgi:ATP diphosphatase